MKSFAASPAFRAFAALAAIVLAGCLFNADGAFFALGTHRDMLRQISVPGILACGMTLAILTGGIDLSVGSVLGLSAVLSSLATIYWGAPSALAIPACVAAGAAMGSVSGALIARFGVQPFVATLAAMVFARGLAKRISGGEKISTYSPKAQLPDGSYPDPPAAFDLLDSSAFGGNLAVVTLVFFGCVAASWFLLEFTRFGRYVRAIGGCEEAARHSGVPVRRTKLLAYAWSGAMAAIAGVCQAAQETHGDPETGQGYELTAIAIVVIGGTSLSGGRGGMGLALVGALTIGYLEKILSLNAVGESTRLMLTGAIVVGAVLFQMRRERV